MIRLTILFTLKPYVDEEAFLNWQVEEYQKIKVKRLGVIHADFGRTISVVGAAEVSYHQFITAFDWNDRESFEQGFFDRRFQVDFLDKLRVLSESTVIVSETLVGVFNEIEDQSVRSLYSNNVSSG